MACEILLLSLLLGLFEVTLQNPLQSELSLDVIEALLQSLNSQSHSKPDVQHQRNPAGSHHAAHTKHETGKPELLNLQNLNLIFKHNNLGKLLRSASTEPQPLQQRAEDSTCTSPGRCGCGGNRCDDDQQYATRQGDGQDLETLINALKQVSNSRENQRKVSRNRCGGSEQGQSSDNEDQDDTNFCDNDRNEKGMDRDEKNDNLIVQLLKQLTQDLIGSQGAPGQISKDDYTKSKKNARDLNEKSKKLTGRQGPHSDAKYGDHIETKGGHKFNVTQLVKSFNQIIESILNKVLPNKTREYKLRSGYLLKPDHTDDLITPNIKQNDKRVTKHYSEEQLARFYDKYIELVTQKVSKFIITKGSIKDIFNLSEQQQSQIDNWRQLENKEGLDDTASGWRERVKELLFGSDSDIRVYPNRDSEDSNVHVPVYIFKMLTNFIEHSKLNKKAQHKK